MYKLIFKGQHDPSLTQEEACNRLGQIYQTEDLSTFVHWFNGGEVVLKTDISEQEARHYQEHFAKFGIFIEINPPLNTAINPPALFELPPAHTAEQNYNSTHEYGAYQLDELQVENNFIEELKTVFLSSHGRLSRMGYLFFNVILIGLMLLVGIVFSILSAILPSILSGLIEISVNIFSTYLVIMLSIKRLHDLGYSGWWQAIYYGLMFLLILLILSSVFSYFGEDLDTLMAMLTQIDQGSLDNATADNLLAFFSSLKPHLIMIILVNIVWIIILLLPGQTVENRYGAVPPALMGSRKVIATILLVFYIIGIIGMTFSLFFLFDGNNSLTALLLIIGAAIIVGAIAFYHVIRALFFTDTIVLIITILFMILIALLILVFK